MHKCVCTLAYFGTSLNSDLQHPVEHSVLSGEDCEVSNKQDVCCSHLGQGLGVCSKTRHSSHTSVSITFTLTYKDDVRNQTIIGLGGYGWCSCWVCASTGIAGLDSS